MSSLSKTKRLAIYTFWEQKGCVGEYVLFYLTGLQKVAERILVVVNGDINSEGIISLKKLGIEVLIRNNTGLDFSAWQAGLKYYGHDTLAAYDELILCNCSCYGPIGGFDISVEQMTTQECDFWGYTKHNAIKIKEDDCMEEHLQSYFLVLKKRVFTSKAFFSWWEQLTPSGDFWEEVRNHECKFTAYLKKLGFSYDTFFKGNADDKDTDDPCFAHALELLKSGVPLFKRKLFSLPYAELTNALNGDDSKDILKYLQDTKSYNIEIILKDLYVTDNLEALKNNLIFDSYTKYQMRKNIVRYLKSMFLINFSKS